MKVVYTKAQQKRNRAKWVKALRSGKYSQITGTLRGYKRFCCLGVACDISKLGKWTTRRSYSINKKKGFVGTLGSARIRDFLGIQTNDGEYTDSNGFSRSLVKDNDDRRFSFDRIANIIENEPKGLFV